MVGSILFSLLYLFVPIGAVALILCLDSSSRKKKAELAKQQGTNPNAAVAAPQQTQAEQKPKNPYTLFNVLLFIGSMFIIAAVVSFLAQANEDFVPPATMIVTALLYLVGLALYKKVSYLKPVGIAFSLTALFILPFWSTCFQHYGLKAVYSTMISFWLTFIMTAVSSIIFDFKFLNYRAYYWLFFAICSLTFAADEFGPFAMTAVIAGTALSVLPILLYGKKVSWIPVKYRSAVKNYSVIAPIATAILGLLFSVAAPEDGMAIYRTILFTCLTFLVGLEYCLYRKKYLFTCLLRLSLQALVISVVADIIGYRFIDLFEYEQPDSALIVGLAIFATSLIQGIISVIAKPQTENQHIAELLMSIIAMCGMAFAATAFETLTSDMSNICYIIVEIAIASLGVSLCIRRRNVLWCIPSLLALACIPTHLGELLPYSEDNSLIISIGYAVLSIVLSLLYVPLRKIDAKKSLIVTITALCFFSLFSFAHSLDCRQAWATAIPFFGFGIASAALGSLAKNKTLVELSAYSGAIALCSVLDGVQDATIIKTKPNYSSYRYSYDYTYGYYLIDFLKTVIVSGSILAVSLWREVFSTPATKLRVRLAFAVYIFALFGFGTAMNGRDNDYLSLVIVYMLVQAVTLAISVAKHKVWLVVTSIIALICALLSVVGDAPYLWIGFIGLGLIGFVAFEMSRITKKNAVEEAKKNNMPTPAEDPKKK